MTLRDCVTLPIPADGESQIPRGRSGNSLANHTWSTRGQARARRALMIQVVQLRSFGFDSHHPLHLDSKTWKGPSGPFVVHTGDLAAPRVLMLA